MKIGFRKPSLKKRIAARTSLKRVVRHNMGFKAPKGMGLLTNPKKAVYNKVYNKVTIDPLKGASRRRRAAKGESETDFYVGCLSVVIFVGLVIYFLFFKD